MWQCPQCGLKNEDIDELCLRCQAPRQAAAAEDAKIAAAVPGAVQAALNAQPPTALLPVSPASRPRRGMESLAIAIIVISLLGLCGVAYVAWTQGVFDAKQSKVVVTPVTVSEGDKAPDLAVEDALAAIEQSDKRELRPYRPHVELLRSVDKALLETSVEVDAPGVLSEKSRQQLHALADLGRSVSTAYLEFEEQSGDRDRSGLAETEQLRRAFIERMTRMVDKAGDAYIVDDDLNHPVYMLSDSFASAIEQGGAGDGQPLRERWLKVVHGRDQRLLDDDHSDDYLQLQARIDTLREIHANYASALAAIPPYKIRGGFIGKDAELALESYEGLATKVEEVVIEFETFISAYPEQDQPDRMKKMVDEFTALAQEDHLFAFRETYRIYAQDRALKHPAYDRLKDHYAFVEQHWPANAGTYRQIYLQYEEEWAKAWDED
jgi:predicted outer membrane protein